MQVQSSWFPLMDRNPRTEDFQAATHERYRRAGQVFGLEVKVLTAAPR